MNYFPTIFSMLPITFKLNVSFNNLLPKKPHEHPRTIKYWTNRAFDEVEVYKYKDKNKHIK